jgi:hypothetical protein
LEFRRRQELPRDIKDFKRERLESLGLRVHKLEVQMNQQIEDTDDSIDMGSTEDEGLGSPVGAMNKGQEFQTSQVDLREESISQETEAVDREAGTSHLGGEEEFEIPQTNSEDEAEFESEGGEEEELASQHGDQSGGGAPQKGEEED